MNTQLTIRRIKHEELSLIRDFAPTEWNINLEKLYNHYYPQTGFYPIIATIDNLIVGTAIAIIHKEVSWLGTIIVKEEYRNKGFGHFLTSHLIEHSQKLGAKSILLVASDMGLPVYKKLGFQHDLNYLFFKSEETPSFSCIDSPILPIEEKDYDEIMDLDSRITSENRKEILLISMQNGFKFFIKKVTGYYLPDFGNGLIIAEDNHSGLELMKFKLLKEKSTVCIPETNSVAIDFLQSIGYSQYLKSPRMFLGKNIEWKSECVFARGCGYLG